MYQVPSCLRFSRHTLLNLLMLFTFIFYALVFLHPNAKAEEYYFNYSPSATENKQISHRAGQTLFINSLYNSSSLRLLWEMAFQPSPTTAWVPNGLYFVVNNGFFPKGRQGETAIFFFDATDLSSPKLTVYAYNGNDAGDSWKIGDFAGVGAPDPIISSINNSSWINSLKVTDTAGARVFSIDVKVALINSHIPKYPSPRWVGAKFDSFIGVWAHPVANMISSYDQNGFLSSLKGNGGYVDIARDSTAGCDGVVGSTKVFDSCGVCGGDGSSCGGISDSGCQEKDAKNDLIVLDSRAAALKTVVLKGADRLLRLARRSVSNKANVKKIKLKAEKLYNLGWQATWSIPSVLISCPLSANCQSIDTSGFLNRYEKVINDFSRLVDDLNRKIKRLGGKKTKAVRSKIRSQADAHIKSAGEVILGIPSSTSKCS